MKKELLEMAKKSGNTRKAENRRTGCAQNRKKAVAKESLLRKNAQQKHRQELSKYILPTQLGDYIAHPIPQNHPLFTYSAKIDEFNASVSYQPDPAGKLR